MKILELLSKYDLDMNLKVGSKEGTGFFYVGTVGDMINNISTYSQMCFKQAEQLVKNSEDNLENSIKNPLDIEKWLRIESRKEKPNFSYEKYQVDLKDWFDKLERKRLHLKKKRRELKEFKLLQTRDVMDYKIATRSVEKNCLNIIVEGHEVGKYWMINEAESVPSVGFTADSVFNENESDN